MGSTDSSKKTIRAIEPKKYLQPLQDTGNFSREQWGAIYKSIDEAQWQAHRMGAGEALTNLLKFVTEERFRSQPVTRAGQFLLVKDVEERIREMLKENIDNEIRCA